MTQPLKDPITVRESCIEVIQDLLQKGGHSDDCALRRPFDDSRDVLVSTWPLCSCGHLDGLDAAYDLIALLRGDHP
jgi:hypothetical protein